MSVESNIFGAAGQIESALATIFTAATLTASTPETAASFQKTRPRVECVMEVGAEKQSYHVFTDGSMRNATYNGQLSLTIIGATVTEVRAIEALVMNAMAVMKDTLNTVDINGDRTYLPFHEVQRITRNSFIPTYPFQDGYIATKLIYSFEFGVIQDAWAELGLTPA